MVPSSTTNGCTSFHHHQNYIQTQTTSHVYEPAASFLSPPTSSNKPKFSQLHIVVDAAPVSNTKYKHKQHTKACGTNNKAYLSPECTLSNYMVPSPINTEQETRNDLYNRRQREMERVFEITTKNNSDDDTDDEVLIKEDTKCKLNRNAPSFKPLKHQSKSAKLQRIDEDNTLRSPASPVLKPAKSAPTSPRLKPIKFVKTCANTYKESKAYNKYTKTKANEHRIKTSRSPPVIGASQSAPLESIRNTQYGYIPNQWYRAQGWIKINRYLTEMVIPRHVRERLVNVYDYLDKTTGIIMYNDCIIDVDNGRIKILNYGFHGHNNELLLLVADKQHIHYGRRTCEYVMRDLMYTKDEIYNLYNIVMHDTYPSGCDTDINGIFHRNPAALCQNVIFKTKWNKLPTYYGVNHNYNKQRLTFAMSKTEFVNAMQQCIYNSENHHKKALIPIIMFNDNGYRVEYVQMVEIRNNIHIGISYIYNTQRNTFKATGIHLNKENIQKQHELIAPHHDCHCLDDFHSDIDHIHIGNPDDDKNRIKDLKTKNDKLRNTNDGLQKEVRDLKNKIRQLAFMSSPIHLSPVSPPQYIRCVTPQSISNTPPCIPTNGYTNSTPQSVGSYTQRSTFSEYSANFR